MHNLLFVLSQALVFPQQSDIYLEVVGDPHLTKDWVFFAPHETEFVANQYVAKQVVDKGGVFIILRQDGKRLITLNIDGTKVKIDPNRIFTSHGRIESIKKLNPTIAEQKNLVNKTEQLADNLSKFVLKALNGNQKPTALVAMHNNTNGYENDGKNGVGDVSIIRYQKKFSSGANYLIDVSHGSYDEDDLYFMTDRKDFEAAKEHGWNAVLQNPQVAYDPSEDDGSLSVYAEMKGYRYINVEAERVNNGFGEDHLSVQTDMVDFVFSLLEENNE
ncbi:hypothetical protein Q4503_11450 [Colwellia sp. 6_MG-2023]|uniref:hypothetical protein n=1 Tax=Colwellia sp. 6_MG-2023 TaxID=3062676 RepID=UPI0026E11DA5|nr:hypothetical protein [Colwellia sp. 6_MG-2023]MDO6488321.1 hypothetical protein [Colwellia sp. 6_MG-2023]